MVNIEVYDEVSWRVDQLSDKTQFPVLVYSGELIILATRWSRQASPGYRKDEFEGIVVKTPNKTWTLGQFSSNWAAQEFYIAPESVVVKFRNRA